ncbi:MAG: hypothetical protein KDN22_00975 [Verrucomicrobiae bacterium]|nr:hypothetical protein [Verrucomicrobiae bacterium]
MNWKVVTCIGAAFAAGGLAGWQFGRSSPANGEAGGRGSVITRFAMPVAGDDDSKPNGKESASTAQVDQWRSDPNSLRARARLITHAASLDLVGVRAALENTRGSESPNDWVFTQALMERWAELDVDGLIEEAQISTDNRMRWYGIGAAFKNLAAIDADAAWARADQLGSGARRNALDGIVAYLQIDQPQRALDFLAKSNIGNDWMTGVVIAQWASRDPDAAAAAALGMKTGERRNRAVNELARSWAERDPDAAFAWSKGLTNVAERHSAVQNVLWQLARQDPAKALGMLKSGDVDEHRDTLVRAIASAKARTDFDGALQFALGQATFADKSSALMSVTSDLTRAQADQLMALAKTLPANLAKGIYESGIWEMTYNEPERLNEWIDQIPVAAIRETVMKRAAESLAWRSPDKAREIFEKLQPSAQEPDMAARIARSLADSDPKAAAEWASGMENVAIRKEALSSVVRSWANRDPEGAKEYIQSIENPDVRRDTMASLTDGMATRSLKEAETWALNLEGADRSAALASIVKNAASRDPEHAPELYETFASGLDGEDADRSEYHQVASAVANQMAQTEPARAVEWLGTLPDGKARDEAMGGLASAWASYDPYATSAWLQQQEPGSGRDIAAGKLITTIARDDPDSAWQWATAIGEASRRREAAATVIEAWKNNGRKEDAAAALGNSGSDLFSASALEELAKKLD